LGVVRELLIILGIWSYAVFTGLSPSVVRASVMITIYAVIGVMRRDRMSLNALALTAIIMLFANPLCLYDVGFQMSFLAVFFILVYYKPVYRLVSSSFLMRHPVLKWIWAMVVVSCCAQLGVAPLTAYYFGRFSCYFLLTNFVVIPLATVILYLAAAMMMASLWPSLLSLMAKVLSIVVGLQTAMVRWVSSLPEASIEGITINRVQLLLVYVIIMAFSVVAYYFTRGVRRRASF
jgi:competence protein ComEC